MGLQVKKQTAEKIRRLLNRGMRTNPRMTTTASYRYDSHVIVTDVEGDNGYPCEPEYLDPVQWEWISFEGPAVVLSANGDQLAIGKSYRAICYGAIEVDAASGSASGSEANTTQVLVFVCDTAPIGCGLKFNEGLIELDMDAIAGNGLVSRTTSSGSASGAECETTLSVDICSTTWTSVTGITSLAISSGNLVLTLATTTRRLAIVGGKVCHEQVSTGSISGSIAVGCTSVVTGVSCVAGEIVGTTTNVRTLGSC